MRVEWIVFLVIAALGLLMMITKKSYLTNSDRYTDESLKKYSRFAGIIVFVMGLSGFGFLYTFQDMLSGKMPGWVVIALLAIFVAAIVLDIVNRKKTLVKK